MILMMLVLVGVPAAARDKTPPPPPRPLPASVDGLPIGPIPKQELPARGCAAFLWTTTPSHAMIAMAVADPAAIRLGIDGAPRDFVMTAQNGVSGYGFSQTMTYQGGDVTAVLEMTISARADLAAGASVPEATLRVDRPGRDSIVVPVAGLIGCAA
jgi:hypothetical protein